MSAHRVVGFVAVHVDQLAVFAGQFDGAVDGLLAELACPLEVRDAADAVRAHLQRLLDHLVAALVGVHALLREGDDLDGDVVLELFADLQHRLQAGQLWIIHVDVGADELDAFGNLFLDALQRTFPGVLERLGLLDIVPAGDAFEERAARVRGALAARGVDVIQVQVGVHVGRDHQTAPQVDFLVCLGQTLADLLDDALVDQDLAGFIVLPVDASVGELLHGFLLHGLADDTRGRAQGAFGQERDDDGQDKADQ